MRLTKAMMVAMVSLGLAAGCAERPGKKKDDGKADKKTKDGKAAKGAKADDKADPEPEPDPGD